MPIGGGEKERPILWRLLLVIDELAELGLDKEGLALLGRIYPGQATAADLADVRGFTIFDFRFTKLRKSKIVNPKWRFVMVDKLKIFCSGPSIPEVIMDCLCIKGLSPTCNRAKLDSNGNLQVADAFLETKYFQNGGAVTFGDSVPGIAVNGPFPSDGQVISSLAVAYTNPFCRDVHYITFGRFANIGMYITPDNNWGLAYGVQNGPGIAGEMRMTTFGFTAAQLYQQAGGWHWVSAGMLAPGATLNETLEVTAHVVGAAPGTERRMYVGRLMYRVMAWSV